MKKILITLLFGMFLMIPQESHAQFFKQLGKVAENVGKNMLDNATNGPFQASAEKATCTVTDVTCVLQTVTRVDANLQCFYHYTKDNQIARLAKHNCHAATLCR